MSSRVILGGALAFGVLAAPGSVSPVVSASGGSHVHPAGPSGECDWVDPAAVADLTVLEAIDELSELTTFSAAVSATDLSADLAGEGPFTVFAPSNEAFQDIPENVWDSILADLDLLSEILRYHVVAGDAFSPDDLADAGTVETRGGMLAVAADGDVVTVNDGAAIVTCGVIQTANATIYVVDQVLQPASSDITGRGACPGSSVPGSSVPEVSVAPDPSVAPDVSTVSGDSVPGSSVPC